MILPTSENAVLGSVGVELHLDSLLLSLIVGTQLPFCYCPLPDVGLMHEYFTPSLPTSNIAASYYLRLRCSTAFGRV